MRISRRLLAALLVAGLPLASFVILHAQGRATPIQSAEGGAGPMAAPDAKDPANAKADLSPKPAVRALTADEEAKQFWLPPGYRLEPVLSDPLIDSPGQI